MKCGGHVGCVTRKNGFNFGEDPNLDPDTIIFFILLRDFSSLRNVAKNDMSHDISNSCGRALTKLCG